MDLTPWSTPYTPDATISSSFQINAGLGGGEAECGAAPRFSPTLATGSPTRNQAASFSTLTTTIGREDGNQDLGSVSLRMPPGLSGILAGVKLCPEVQANAGTCGPSSLIGEAIVSVGVGGDPFSVKGGKVYITGPYKGAPFGLSIVTPAVVGPFDLGNVV
jgi:hypothetical protein